MDTESNGVDGNKDAIERIINRYPLHEETFVSKTGQLIIAVVSRDDEKNIIYVRPKSVKAHSALKASPVG